MVLFDEIEKAHPDIQNILLQILEDGQLTDAMGRKADFRNTIVLLTSNLGARFLAGQSAPLGFAAGSEAVFEKQSAQAIEEAKKWFRPELVGRLDELIVFRPLAEDSLCAIAEKLLGQLEARAARNGYQLTHTPRWGQCWPQERARPMEPGSCGGRWTARWNRPSPTRSPPARPTPASTGPPTARWMGRSCWKRGKQRANHRLEPPSHAALTDALASPVRGSWRAKRD